MVPCPRPHGRGGFKRVQPAGRGLRICPRPHGRGGFKPKAYQLSAESGLVPARMGGVDLSRERADEAEGSVVPARMGGVDLSLMIGLERQKDSVPARMGGVDLSVNFACPKISPVKSPPAWAGWI